jgi:AcrR family transcriptional regulator
VGRPREHDARTRSALTEAAAELVAQGGPEALTVRAVADEARVTTRAVYSVFGSKDGLVSALARQAFEFLQREVAAMPESDDPARDLVDIGLEVYRRFVREHPSLFRIAFQRIIPEFELGPELVEARLRAWEVLEGKVRRLEDAGLLGGRSVTEAAVAFNAMCEGLGNAELRGGTLRVLPEGEEARAWRDAYESLVAGFAVPPPGGS